jgi:hypothetical protein
MNATTRAVTVGGPCIAPADQTLPGTAEHSTAPIQEIERI